MELDNKELFLAWAAGLFEGEGTITIFKNKRIRAAIEMTDLDVLETFKKHFGGGLITLAARKEHYKPTHKWCTTSNEKCAEFINEIMPYLHKRRRERAQEALDVYEEWRLARIEKKEKIMAMREDVKNLIKTGLTHREIAKMFNVDRSHITHIVNGDYE